MSKTLKVPAYEEGQKGLVFKEYIEEEPVFEAYDICEGNEYPERCSTTFCQPAWKPVIKYKGVIEVLETQNVRVKDLDSSLLQKTFLRERIITSIRALLCSVEYVQKYIPKADTRGLQLVQELSKKLTEVKNYFFENLGVK